MRINRKELSRPGSYVKHRIALFANNLFRMAQTSAALQLATERFIGGQRAGRALLRRSSDFVFTNRIADADDHKINLSDNANYSQVIYSAVLLADHQLQP